MDREKIIELLVELQDGDDICGQWVNFIPAGSYGQVADELCNQWISVEDELPERFQEVWITHVRDKAVIKGKYTGKYWIPDEYFGKDKAVHVSHWMKTEPLPSAPESMLCLDKLDGDNSWDREAGIENGSLSEFDPPEDK